MGRGDSKRSRKMRRRKSQRQLKARIKRQQEVRKAAKARGVSK